PHPTAATRATGGKSPLRGALGLFLPAYRGRADNFIAFGKKNWGSLSPQREGANPKNGNQVAVCFYYGAG
ncbi:hypothetical protein, partial [Enterobacter cloacae]|uniref:hypothetical protein n=1 Tax=Enterobacter cloacae TaxID=550 RepID=UPI001BD035DF